MVEKYDFYKCKRDKEKRGIALPEDINRPVLDWLIKHKCEEGIPDIKNIQNSEKPKFGVYTIACKDTPNIYYEFNYQCGIILNWYAINIIEREKTVAIIKNSYKNNCIKIEKRKKNECGSSESDT